MNWIALDLELNKPSNKIIQIGAVCGDLLNDEKPVSRFSTFVNPEETIDDFITRLTNIEQHHVENAPLLDEAYQLLYNWIKSHENIMRNCVTWGGGDSIELREQLGLDQDEFVFGRTWFDIKKVYQLYQYSRGQKIQSGLAKSMTKLGLKFEGTKHRADDDAYNTWIVAKHLLTKFNK